MSRGTMQKRKRLLSEERRAEIRKNFLGFLSNTTSNAIGDVANNGIKTIGKGKVGKAINNMFETIDNAKATTERTDKITKIAIIAIPAGLTIGIVLWGISKLFNNKNHYSKHI